MGDRRGILFTAFEPSGDEHAAPVIAQLRKLNTDIPIWAMGGPRMVSAGATLIEQTCGRGTMLGDSLGEVRGHLKRMKRLRTWLHSHPVAVHVPTDSPAANWGICKLVRRHKAQRHGALRPRTVHLVAPQVWAWAPWRVRKLRRWSDLVLCLLPFEPAWFEHHGVNARFIGHPLFDAPLTDPGDTPADPLPEAPRRVALLPGSRPGEIRKNWPDLLEAFARLSQQMPDLHGGVVAVHEKAEERLKRLAPDWPANLTLRRARLHEVLDWAQAVLAVSGTVTLHVARHGKPMTIMYRINPAGWHLVGRWLVQARTFTLPNLIAGDAVNPDPATRIVREFIPFWGDVQPLVDEMTDLLTDQQRRVRQQADLKRVVDVFQDHTASSEAAHAILDQFERV